MKRVQIVRCAISSRTVVDVWYMKIQDMLHVAKRLISNGVVIKKNFMMAVSLISSLVQDAQSWRKPRWTT